MTRVTMFVEMDTELVKKSSKKAEMAQESSSKRAGDELEQEKAKKIKIDDDEAEMKKHMEIVSDDEVAIDAIPLGEDFSVRVTSSVFQCTRALGGWGYSNGGIEAGLYGVLGRWRMMIVVEYVIVMVLGGSDGGLYVVVAEDVGVVGLWGISCDIVMVVGVRAKGKAGVGYKGERCLDRRGGNGRKEGC
ncbi:hypothetical protein Tco_0352193 [Tanacetum coccineum]